MNRLSLRNNRLKFKTSGNLLIILEEFKAHTVPQQKNRKMSACDRLDLETFGSQPIMPKYLPGHCFQICNLRRWIMLLLSAVLSFAVVMWGPKAKTPKCIQLFISSTYIHTRPGKREIRVQTGTQHKTNDSVHIYRDVGSRATWHYQEHHHICRKQ
jgi:hypothetical protein